MIGGGEPVSLIDAPALAELTQRILRAPHWALTDDRPFPVEPQLWLQAYAEWRKIMKDRGWDVPDIAQKKFLFSGVPIVMGD